MKPVSGWAGRHLKGPTMLKRGHNVVRQLNSPRRQLTNAVDMHHRPRGQRTRPRGHVVTTKRRSVKSFAAAQSVASTLAALQDDVDTARLALGWLCRRRCFGLGQSGAWISGAVRRHSSDESTAQQSEMSCSRRRAMTARAGIQ